MAEREPRGRLAERLASDRVLVGVLAGLFGLSVLLRVLLVTRVHAPTVFNDELGYTKLAQSIGLEGRLGLFNQAGLSYPPLYPALLAPIYALGASAPAAYAAIKIVNAFLISLAVFPIYKIARFVLPRQHSVLVAAVSVFAPLMSFAAFAMSENLAYPLCLLALWAMLVALRAPRPRADVLLLLAILAAAATRIQLIVLFPVALTAVVLVAVCEQDCRLGRRLVRMLRRHWVLFGVTGAALLVAAARALMGGEVYSVLGRYQHVGRVGLPSPARVFELALHHVAGLDLAVGVVPFVGALAAAFVFVRSGFPRRYLPFAAVAVAFTGWVVLQNGVIAALFDRPGLDLPRIHERFMIYAVPLFLIALFAAVRVCPDRLSGRVLLAAAASAAALPALIPFDTYINLTNGVDTFALLPFAETHDDGVAPIRFAALAAVWLAAAPAILYVRLLRRSTRGVAALLVIVFTFSSAFVWLRLDKSSTFARSLLPTHADWVDRAEPPGETVLVADGDADPALETAFHNLSIARVYTLCALTFSAEFGEKVVTIDTSGRLRDASRHVSAAYAVVPARLGVRGRVVARNARGRQVLVAPDNGRLTVAPGAAEGCSQSPR